MPQQVPNWVLGRELPSPPTYEHLLEFFGIPPDTLDRLDDNIARKRRYWHDLTNKHAGRDTARHVKERIQRAAQAIKRGVAIETDGWADAPAVGLPVDIDELWRVVEELVFGNDLDGALRVAATARSRSAASPTPHAAYAWVVSVGAKTGQIVHPALLTDGLGAAERAVGMEPANGMAWESKIELLVALQRPVEALAAASHAETALGGLDPRLRASRAALFLELDRGDDAMADAARAVADAPDDAAIRSRCVTALVSRLVEAQLPITSAAGLKRYVEAVGVAAWCAQGVPEAEDLTRSHRLWAAQAGQRVFAGSWPMRSLVGIATAFVALPLYNRARSAPMWKVFLKGPDGNPAWSLVTSSGFVRAAHRHAADRLPWADERGRWPMPLNGDTH